MAENKFAVEPDLKSLLDVLKTDILASTNCHAIGTVQSFDSSVQTVQATLVYKKTVNGSLKNYPILVDCPVVILSGGPSGLTFPVAQGDDCLVLFNDRDIDNWFIGATTGELSTQRNHAFSDAIVLVGLRSQVRSIEDYDMDRASLYNGDTRVAVGASKVLIENDMTTLLTVLDGLIDVIKTSTTIPAAVGVPLTLNAATLAALEAYKATIGGLLE
jgi:Phage protein Gp138 N-terminal domain